MYKNKTTATVIALILMFAIAIALVALPLANAQHSPGWNVPTFAFINAAPNPVGVGQKVDILIWVDKPRTNAALQNEYRQHNYKLTILDSDNNVVLNKFWETVIDSTSSQYYAWTPDKVGTYTLNFNFEGFYAGDYPSDKSERNDTFLPSSASLKLTVQEEQLPDPITSYPLPAEYWTRPIYGENTDWWKISSHWLGTGSPDIAGFSRSILLRAPKGAVGSQTAHIMWTKPLEDGGVVGGDDFVIPGVTWFEGSAYQQRFTNPIIVAGRLYYNPPVSYLGPTRGPTTCVDLRTGEVIWVRDDVPAISFAYIYDVQNPNQHGTYPAILFTSSFARAFDAYTGNALFNVTSPPSGTAVLGPQGEHLRYTFFNNGTSAKPDWYLCQWNSSKMWRGAGWATDTTGNSPAYDTSTTTTWRWVNTTTWVNNVKTVTSENVTTSTTAIQASRGIRYDWNVSIPWRAETGSPTVVAAFYNDIMICRNGSLPTYSTQRPYTYFAVSLKDDYTRGQVLWWKTYNPAAGNITVEPAGADPINRVFVESYKETTQFVGYSMVDGNRLWTTEGQTALDYYGNPYYPYIVAQVAYGKLYSSALGGILYCYDTATGKLLWTYGNGGEGNSTYSGFYLAYGHYPLFINAIGNGIIYTVTTEHTVNTPIYKGALTRAINATDGTEIYTLSAYTGEFSQMSLVIADGFTTFFNGYDNQLYTVGRGPSVTTVSVPDAAVPFDAPLVVKGTVMDISAGTKQNEQAVRFPNGVPAVSDASMTDWMGYVYQQRPLPMDMVGVDVTLSVLDSNGNYYDIGTVTTDSNGFFQYTWVPGIPGDFTVYARFDGSNGYWPSQAVTAFTVMEAPEATPAPTPTPMPMSEMYFVPAVIGIIVTIAVVGIGLALLMLRKRQ